ncbi:MAG: hypothetical protein L6R36_001722 [Xanthoria steineri]|nr:MAG: hypothetical protein L6R36_001722 [Xanthoria steineri]
MAPLSLSVVNGVNDEYHPVMNGLGHATTNGVALNGHAEHQLDRHCTTDGITLNGDPAKGHHPVNKVVNGSSSDQEMPLAVCGMAVRLPGAVTTPQQLWEFLLAKGDARIRVPETRYSISAYHSNTAKPGTVATEYGYFLDETVDLGALDTSFFTMPRTEVERADPQQRLMLEVARECIEDAGVTRWRGKTIGCYMGSFGEDWTEMFAKEPQQYGVHRIAGYGDFALANRVSYEMDLRGPSMTLRTGCSAALVGLNEACMAISRGDCEAALVGGVNLIMAPGMTSAMTEQGVLSKDGSCKTFSADANGYARGEAITAIYVKPLSHAIRDGNPVRAVIRSTSTNVDGKTPGMSYPSTTAQEAVMRHAYKIAGISDYGLTAMVECHGTGTPVGDPIEANAVARVFGEAGVYIGSVKPNLGHAEGASGLVSVIKMILALENRIIPPNIRFTNPNPAIPFKSAKLTVPLDPIAWPQSRHERVSVNSFGIGGANAHVILDSAASFNASPAIPRRPTTPQLLLYSANSPQSLNRTITNYQRFVEKNSDSVADLAYTLANRREHLPHRSFSIVNNGVMGNIAPPVKAGPKPNLVMVFTGQGAQWPLMGRDLFQSSTTFRESIRSLDRYLSNMARDVPSYSIEEELLKPGKKSRLNIAEFSQPLCTAIQIALVDTLSALAITPDAVVGHSSGEIAAAYATGALSAEESIIAAHHRGAVTNGQTRIGAMAAIGMSWEDTKLYLRPNVTIACENSAKSVTISGDADAVKAVIVDIHNAQPDTMAKLLQVDKAYHSFHMAEIGGCYYSLIDPTVVGKQPSKLFFSSVTGKLLTEGRNLDARYWQDNLESPVRFCEATTSILQHDVGRHAVFLEIGPHSSLAGPLRQIFTQHNSTVQYVSAMVRNQNCTESFLTAIGKLHSSNLPIDLEYLYPTGSCLADLPRYPWNHEDSYWYEPRLCKEWRFRKHPYHDLLGVRLPESTDIEPTWRNLLHLQNVPWIRDHKVAEDIVFPFACYVVLAGEAVRQVSGVDQGFSLRNLIVNVALVLPDGKPTEIMTTFRPHRLTNTLNSQWWDFSVASYNGHSWTKHCTGEVAARSSSLGPASELDVLPRKVGAQKWYDTMRRAGLELGPSFQTLETVDTSTDTQNRAIGKILNGRQGDEANYYIHPTVLDGTLQLLGAACVNGSSRKYKNWLPTSIEQLDISRSASNMVACVSARATGNSSVVGEARCISDGVVVVEALGIRTSLAEGSLSSTTKDTHAAGRYEWGLDLDFLDVGKLTRPSTDHTPYMPLLHELSDLCLRSSHESLAKLDNKVIHMRKYAQWIDNEARAMALSTPANLSQDAGSANIQDLVQRLSNTPAAIVATVLYEICTKTDRLTSGQTLEGILSDETLRSLYRFIDQRGRCKFIQHLGHSIPNIRILEIGTGRGSSARDILADLTLPSGEIRCSKYTFTATGFISAKDQQTLFPNMEFVTLDISQDPWEQGFEDRQYDLVVATNVLHTTKNIRRSLVNIKKLLHPAGRLLLQELCPRSRWVNYIFGVLPGWWCGSMDNRADEPYIGRERWESELCAAGFDPVEVAILDSEAPYHLNAIMVARPSSTKNAGKRVTLLCRDKGDDGDATRIRSQLLKNGHEVDTCTIEDRPPSGQDVISLLDRDGPFFEKMDSARFQAFKQFLLHLGNSGVLWITPLCQIGCQDPRYAQAIGLARTIRTEMLIDFATCEVDDLNSSHEAIVRVFTKFHMREDNEKLKPDLEYAIRKGEVHVGRVYPLALHQELMIAEPSDKAVLDIGTPGRLNTLHWSRQVVPEPQADQVEIEVYSVGLNFRDVLVGMGIVELPERVFGLEAAGIVRRIGPQVKGLKIDDRVACLERNAFSTLVTSSELLCVKIPDFLTFNEAATMLIPFATVIHSLITLGGLEKGQSILIHRAEIYVTVGNDEKRDFLMQKFDIPGRRIFHSRDSSFKAGVMRETQGEGVDVVLNSLSGELLHATWGCVAAFGKMIEIGKRDLLGGGKLDMNTFLANRSYCCVDIDQFRKKPYVLKQLLDSTMEYLGKGSISPIQPIEMFNAASVEDAFRYMQKGQHIGRVGVSLQDSLRNCELAMEAVGRPQTITFDSSASYLLVGGLGGLGRAISTWMVDHKARQLIYLSRSAGTVSGDEDFVNELNSMGCEVKLVQGDVTNYDDVARAVAAATFPLKGVLQMSMVLRDQNFRSMTIDEWNAVTTPKVWGTWHLHNATVAAGADLDFFILFSSLSGLFGQPGQANYASANTFLDAFAQYRTGLGLTASVIDLGSVEDIGFLSLNQGLMEQLKVVGFAGVTERTLLDAMTAACTAAPHKKIATVPSDGGFVNGYAFIVGLGSAVPLNSPSNRAVWRRDRRMAIYHNETHGGSGDSRAAANETLKSYLNRAKADASLLKTAGAASLFAMEIGRKLLDLLLQPQEELNTDLPLVDLGLDSLVALELRAWWKQVFSFDISVLEMLGMGSLAALGQHAADCLLRIAQEESGKVG